MAEARRSNRLRGASLSCARSSMDKSGRLLNGPGAGSSPAGRSKHERARSLVRPKAGGS